MPDSEAQVQIRLRASLRHLDRGTGRSSSRTLRVVLNLYMTLQPNTKCEVCSGDFYASPGHKAVGWGKYCSFICRGKAKGGESHPNWDSSGDVKCQNCGIEFHRKPSQKGKQTFCSQKCWADSTPEIDRTCKKCGKLFVAASWKVNQGVAIYCSVKCKMDSMPKAQMTTINCLGCKNNFSVKRSRLFSIRTGEKRADGAGNFCSTRCKNKFLSGSPLAPSGAVRNGVTRRAKGGRRADLNLFVRSSWEANYARYLNFLIKNNEITSWEYEPDTFEFADLRGSASFYTPDFKILKLDGKYEYHEVKGWMDPKSATKLKRMHKYFPEVDLVLIHQDIYKALAREVSGVVPNWE